MSMGTARNFLPRIYSGQWSAQTTSQQGRGNPACLKDEVRSFLGLFCWYRRIIPEFATLGRKLLPREQRYSTFEKECLATKCVTIGSVCYYLLRRVLDLEMDHRVLSWINTMKDHNAWVTQWYLSLQPFQFQVRHIPGKRNVVADYLSHVTHGSPPGEGGGDVEEEIYPWLNGSGLHIHTRCSFPFPPPWLL